MVVERNHTQFQNVALEESLLKKRVICDRQKAETSLAHIFLLLES
jgi:hypothetical protein